MTTPTPPPRRGLAIVSIPQEMRELPNWIGWVYVWVEGSGDKPGRFTKEPRVTSGTGQRKASSTDPATWCNFSDAVEFWRTHQWLSGIGFVFTDTPFAGIDLDHKIDDEGNIDPMAIRVIRMLDSYTERTPSRHGFHIVLRGKLHGHGQNDQARGLEVYDGGRFFTVTGDRVSGQALEVGRL